LGNREYPPLRRKSPNDRAWRWAKNGFSFIFSPGEKLTVFTLCLVAMAGLLAPMPVMFLKDLQANNDNHAPWGVILAALAVFTLAQYGVLRLIKKAWFESHQWKLFGMRRPLWLIFIPVAYLIGAAGGLLVIYDS